MNNITKSAPRPCECKGKHFRRACQRILKALLLQRSVAIKPIEKHFLFNKYSLGFSVCKFFNYLMLIVD